MNIHNVEMLISAVSPKQYPPIDLPEIALAGRSNVGKSSFINKLLNRNNFARTSSKPGKTATLNFYEVDQTFRFVDLPGYGYAQVSKEEKKRWASMIETYLNCRENLAMTLLIVDGRHKPTQDDMGMIRWIRSRHGWAAVIVTKCDKVKKSQLQENLNQIMDCLELQEDDVIIPFSGETGLGKEDAWDLIYDLCEIEDE